MIADLSLEHRGYPVPWFALWKEGKPDLRVADGDKIPMALNHRLCWICGDALGELGVFVAGDLCALNRLAPEPPSHEDCARYAITTCPYLALTQSKRRVHGMTKDHSKAYKCQTFLLWATKDWTATPSGLVQMGDPVFVETYRGGQRIT